jgi:hypothetical protein
LHVHRARAQKRDGQHLKHVSWDERLRTFEERDLEFIYQETMADGKQSNLFRLASPERG